MKDCIFYSSVFLLVYFLYYFTIIRKKEKVEQFKQGVEFTYLIKKYKLDLKKQNQKQMAKQIALLNSLIITVSVFIISFFSSFIIKILIGFVLVFTLIILGYHFYGLYLKKKERNYV